ncbi:MAG: TIGR04282 family arsenosugar biosynthesis glycosyltransferase [Ectothiorhodospiraceae bacterium]|jgi:hypothetical protein
MNQPLPRRLLVFAKAPVAGRVKTRLAGAYGSRGAARIYANLLDHTLRNAAAVGGVQLQLWASPNRHPRLRSLAGCHGIPVRVQPPGDLGRRMDRALRRSLVGARAACIMGGDCPALTPASIHQAFQELDLGVDAVFVPAEDGGYALVGLRRPVPGLFQAVPWGSAEVMRVTRRRLRAQGIRWRELAPSFDVDRPADVRRWRRQCRLAGQRLPSMLWAPPGVPRVCGESVPRSGERVAPPRRESSSSAVAPERPDVP